MGKDLREWLNEVSSIGEVRRIPGVNWDLEIGALTELAYRRPGGGPTLVFDDITGYTSGFRVLTNSLGSLNRLALTLGLSIGLNKKELTEAWGRLSKEAEPIPPEVIASGPVYDNELSGNSVDLFRFPAPRWHEFDGGRYIGTGSVTITRDPDTGLVNLGCYRVQIQDERHVTCAMAPGKHGWLHRERYFKQGKPCPVAISIGHDPLIYMAGGIELPHDLSEYDFCGGIKGEAIEVVASKIHGLPIPAHAEIVLEGSSLPTETCSEGPFGEWTGYYGGKQIQSIIDVQAIYYRNDPIILGAMHSKPPEETQLWRAVTRSVLLKEALDRNGVPGVTAVWCHECGGTRLLLTIAIQQQYPGHSRQAALVALGTQVGAYLGRYVVIVDDDVDATDLQDVAWAICTRTDPAISIDIVRNCWSSSLDPIVPPGKPYVSSRAIIDATIPYSWKDRFPLLSESDPALRARVHAKWNHLLT